MIIFRSITSSDRHGALAMQKVEERKYKSSSVHFPKLNSPSWRLLRLWTYTSMSCDDWSWNSFCTSWISSTCSISSVFASVREIVTQTPPPNKLLSETVKFTFLAFTSVRLLYLWPGTHHTFRLHRLLPFYDSVTVTVGIYHTYLLRGSAPHGCACTTVK